MHGTHDPGTGYTAVPHAKQSREQSRMRLHFRWLACPRIDHILAVSHPLHDAASTLSRAPPQLVTERVKAFGLIAVCVSSAGGLFGLTNALETRGERFFHCAGHQRIEAFRPALPASH